MNRLFLLVAVMAMVLPGCGKIEESIDATNARIDKLEQETIPSIDEQIAAINVSLDALDAMDKELKGYIDGLQATADKLQEKINETNTKIDAVKAELQGEISDAKAAVLAELEALKTELKNELAQINATIETLKAKDEELDKKIADLKTYVDTELGKTTDWVNATFATLEQYNALVAEVTMIKAQIVAINQSIADLETRLTTKINEDIATAVSTLNTDIQQKVKEITDGYTEAVKNAKEEVTIAYKAAIATAISNLEASLKSWVGEQLSNYYTIAEMDAKIANLEKAIADGDSALQQQLNELKSQLETTKQEISAAYKKAIEEAITKNNGVIDQKIASEIAAVNKRIDSEVATINAKIAAIEARLDNVEAQIKDLLARIQSVSYIPTYDDGKATVKYAYEISRVTLDFEISPKDAVVELAKVWQSAVSVKAIYTQTRAISFIDMPIVKFEADATNGVISVTASGENLSAEFFNDTQSASARLSISDGNSSINSDYIPMAAKEVAIEEIFSIPTNEIWYTSSNGKIVTPDTTDVFGANIVSNTYSNGHGVIILDAPVTSIGDKAFYKCTSLTTITIPDSVTSIGIQAFLDCDSLTSITIPDSVTSIGIQAFARCTSLKAFYGKSASADNRCLIVDGVLHSFAPAGLTQYIIPNSVTSIGEKAFLDCDSLTSITIPDSVTSIGDWAFQSCTSLTSVRIPDSVTSIGGSAFYNCSSLTSVTIGNSVTSIGDKAFYKCTSLTTITIPDSVTLIGDWAFSGCSRLTSVTIGNSVTSIGYGAFYNCTSLKSVTIPDSVTSIESYAFYECSSLTSVTIPDSVTSIGNYVFYYCSKLTSVYCKPTTPPTAFVEWKYWYAFDHNASGRKIYVPLNSVSAYKSASGWSEYADYIVGYDFE